MRIISFLFLAFISLNSYSQGFLKVDGKRIVNGNHEEIILRGMGLGGWMLQEPYMLKLSGTAVAQYDIRNKISALVGDQNTEKFYEAWLSNHCTKADIDSLAAWGFNSVRLPMHYNLFTLPIEKESAKGKNTWIEKGFALTDSLLSWCKSNKIYLILDLHAAPGGQGNDNAISDRNSAFPSLWESEDNRSKTVALWEKLARRYVNEEWIGGYDLINEPNWGFEKKEDKNGCAENSNVLLKSLLTEITNAIRRIDKNHIIYIEGNCWANNYNGIFPLWDDNMVVSFHKYWNYTDDASIQKFIDYREKYNVPIWMGETGENSNAWFTDVVRLFEKHKIGWAMWPMKKSGINNLLEVKVNEDAKNIFDYWSGKAAKPDSETAFKGLMTFALNTNIKNNILHKDVVDALSRQISSQEVIPFRQNIVNPDAIIYATDYDMGRSGIAYHDRDSAEYWVSTTKRTPWNKGHVYRNDGVDIEVCSDKLTNGYNVGWIDSVEWMQYSLYSDKESTYSMLVRSAAESIPGELDILINNKKAGEAKLPVTGSSQKWITTEIKNIKINKGWNTLRLYAKTGGFNLNYFQFINSAQAGTK